MLRGLIINRRKDMAISFKKLLSRNRHNQNQDGYDSEESLIPTPAEAAAHQKKKKIVIILVSFLLVILIIVSLVLTNTSLLTPRKTYTDPLNVYTISVPQKWTITKSNAQNTVGQNTNHPQTQQIEVTAFYLPKHYGLSIQVIQGKPQCPLPTLDSKLAGFPAAYDSLAHDWTIPTTTATIQVGISYPGPGRYNNPFDNASISVSPQTIEKDKQLLLNVLKSLSLGHLKPLHC